VFEVEDRGFALGRNGNWSGLVVASGSGEDEDDRHENKD